MKGERPPRYAYHYRNNIFSIERYQKRKSGSAYWCFLQIYVHKNSDNDIDSINITYKSLLTKLKPGERKCIAIVHNTLKSAIKSKNQTILNGVINTISLKLESSNIRKM